ncbi:DUF4139 domain-containing protein [Streptomyces vinaceus]|uniref:DUF4139 domain-containing protein n=1 Tax=Streptomyces vinaceus TaxID=1960 RepID=UPI0036D06B4A
MANKTARTWGSTLDSVVVYAQGAVCRRLVRGSVPPDGRVRVTGLPRSLDPGSLRVRALNAPGVRVTEARVETGAEPLGAGAPDALRREVVRLREECAAAQGRRDRQLGLIEEVRALHPVPPERRRGDPHRRTPVDAWLELAEFVDARLVRLHARLAELEEARRLVEHELSVAADLLARASNDAPSAHVRTTVCAVLTLDRRTAEAEEAEAEEAGAPPDAGPEVELELEYAVPGAVWVPAYRLGHRQGEDAGRLLLRASVAQRTGEDWTGVRIALATADLRRRTDLPKLGSIRIGRRQAAPAPSGWREPPAGLSDLFAGYEAAGPRPARPAPVPTARPAVGTGAAPGSVPPPPPPPSVPVPAAPAPQGYGAATAAFPAPGAADDPASQTFGAAVPAPAPAAPARSRAAGRPAGGGGGGGGRPPPPPPPPRPRFPGPVSRLPWGCAVRRPGAHGP